MEQFTLPPLADRPARVLLCMGDGEIRDRILDVLEDEGHAVCLLPQLDGILEAVRLTLPDLVLLAASLPDGSGLEVVGDLRMLDPFRLMSIGVIAQEPLDEESVSHCLLGGADDVLDSWRLLELSSRVAVQLRNRRDRDLLRSAQKERVQLIDDMHTDPLTTVRNRRAADRALAEPLDEDVSALLLVIDIDHFKRVNDTYGHAAGDEVLRAVGARLGRLARDGDVVARYGGEEFVVLIRNAPTITHRAIAERFHEGIRSLRLRSTSGPPRVTVSVGAVSLAPSSSDAVDPGRPRTLQPLFEDADRLLYHAKRTGRDRVVIAPFGESPVLEPARPSTFPLERAP
ncbi:MAG: diguanylate cyclase [Deltaproteobacteria bacterium]|nr:diguanylate cyclase [Deltaproteobacteria bacterium]